MWLFWAIPVNVGWLLIPGPSWNLLSMSLLLFFRLPGSIYFTIFKNQFSCKAEINKKKLCNMSLGKKVKEKQYGNKENKKVSLTGK